MLARLGHPESRSADVSNNRPNRVSVVPDCTSTLVLSLFQSEGIMMHSGKWRWLAGAALCIILALGAALYRYPLIIGIVSSRGWSSWTEVPPDSPKLSPIIRRVLTKGAPAVRPGAYGWRQIAPGLEVAEMPVVAGTQEVDRIYLTRLDQSRYRFVARNMPTGHRSLHDWMTNLQAAAVINGSYYAPSGRPDTPFLSDGTLLGPAQYAANQGAFVAGKNGAAIVDLAETNWTTAFKGAENAMVSYPILVGKDGRNGAQRGSKWLANRTFVAIDTDGKIVFGTTKEAFFSLDRLGDFLKASPLNIRYALNLDGGPVSCHGVHAGKFDREICGKWEVQSDANKTMLLTWPFGMWQPPIVLAALPK